MQVICIIVQLFIYNLLKKKNFFFKSASYSNVDCVLRLIAKHCGLTCQIAKLNHHYYTDNSVANPFAKRYRSQLTSSTDSRKVNYYSSIHRGTQPAASTYRFEILTIAIAVVAAMSGNKDFKSATSIYDFTANSIRGEEVPLSK